MLRRMLGRSQEGDKDGYLGLHLRYASGSPAFKSVANGSLDGGAIPGDRMSPLE